MANNDPRPRGPSWRKQEAPPPPAPRPAGPEPGLSSGANPVQLPGSPKWRSRPVESSGSFAEWFRSRRAKLIAALVLTGVVIALLFILPLLLRPLHPACLVLIGAPAEDNLEVDHNVFGWQTLTQLTGWITQGDSDRRLPRLLSREPRDLHTLDGWDKGWQDRRENVLVVYLALHGGVDRDEPFFWIDSPTGDPTSQRLPFRTVLASLAKLPESKFKVLILDPTQVPVNWRQGMLHNDFVRALLNLEPEIEKVKNLVVFCSSDVDQRSWVSEEWQQSIFGHYLVAGLRGAAIQGKGNNRLTVGDLHTYVRQHVESWVQTNRHRKQTPLLLPRNGGKELAEQIELAAVTAQEDPKAESAPGARFGVPEELDALWQQAEKLAQLVPSPSVYCPQRWREYRDLSLRYEQVVRAGDPRAKSSVLLGRLGDLERAIRQAHGLNLPSASSTLAMPTALGLTDPWTPAELQEQFRKLWNAPDEAARQKAWEGVTKWLASKGGASEPFRLQLSGLLLEQFSSSPATVEPARVNAIFQLLGTPRPAESHLLFMYLHLTSRVLPRAPGEPTVPPELLKQALLLRRQAEEAALACAGARGEHPYSEHIYPWIQDTIEAADRERRLGEDLLFAPASFWPRSGEHLTRATELYAEASKQAKLLRQALMLRDRALADLPYYSHWLAAGQEEETLFQELEKLWTTVHQLVQALEPPRDAAQRTAQFKQVAELLETRRLARDLDAALARLPAQVEALSDARTQQNWHLHDQALSVPLMTRTNLRRLRVETLRNIGQELNSKSLQNLPGQEEPVAQLAVRQGRMAWATLGEAAIRRLLPNLDIVWARGLLLHRSGDWFRPVGQFGDFIGQCYRQMPAKIEELSLTNPDKPDQMRADLARADLIARQLDGAGSRRLAPRDPPGELRKLRWHDLLLHQAERTYRDHWAADRPGEPYYRQIALRYIDDAQGLLADRTKPADKDPRLALARQARQQMALRPPIKIQGPQDVHWTSERQLPFRYRLDPVAGVLPGLPVLWRQIGARQPDNKSLALLEGKETDRHVVTELGAPQPAESVTHVVGLVDRWLPEDEAAPPPVPTKEPIQFTLHTLFRGHHIEAPTPVQLHRVPHTTGLIYPRPDVGGVALQADGPALARFGQANGVIVFALDMSGSMESKLRLKDGTLSDRLTEAKKALTNILESLPSGPVVSLWAFGTANNIDRVWEPRPWDANPKTGHLPDLLRQLDRFKPSRQVWSAVARTMVEHARKDYDLIAQKWPAQDAGFKTLLVLTDGEDNDFDKISKKPIGDYVKTAYQESGVQLNMILFCSGAQEIKLARGQFGVIEKLPVPGQILEAADEVKLREQMALALRRELRCRLEKNGVPVPGQESVAVGPLDRPPRWFTPLTPHVYALRAYTFRQDIDIGPGDFIQVAMRHDPKSREITFERALLARNYPSKQTQQSRNWIMACFQNMRMATGGLQLVNTLESLDVKPTVDERRGALRGTLLQVRPSFVWFAVTPVEGQPPLCLRFGNMERYPAPAWKLDVPSWPRTADERPMKPVVDGWWAGDRALPPIAQTLRRDPAKGLEEDFGNRPVQIEEGSAFIESVQIEKRIVHAAPDRKLEQDCLVVRLRHPPGRPVVTLLAGLTYAGAEHRLYSDANKYTGIFWPMDEAKLKDLQLQIVSLEAFKQAVRQPELGVHHARLQKLLEPQLGDALMVQPVP